MKHQLFVVLVLMALSGLAVARHAPPSTGWSQVAKLTDPSGSGIGGSVAISGSVVVAGSPGTLCGGNCVGVAYVFVEPNGGWRNTNTPTATLVPSDGGDFGGGFGFGDAVAIDGDTVVVGAPYFGGSREPSGKAYVFVKPSGGWSGTRNETAQLTLASTFEETLLGMSVAVSGKTVLAGSLGVGGPGAGWIFVEPAAGWSSETQTAVLVSSPYVGASQFGYSVSISGETAAIGAYGYVSGGNATGAAFVFVEPGGGWAGSQNPNTILTPSDSNADELGASVSVSGPTVVAGAPYADSGDGADYVFVEPSGGWSGSQDQNAVLTISGGSAQEAVWAVSISGTVVAGGAPNTTVGSNVDQGAVFVFVQSGLTWSNENQTAELTASDGAAGDALGASVSIDSGTIVAGAPGANSGEGAAYIFQN